MTVGKRLRHEILRRDNYTCRYCGASAPDVKMTVDHVTPISLGGSDDPGNLVAACADCNAGKASTPPTAEVIADVAQVKMRWAAAMKRAAEIEAEKAAEAREGRDDLIDTAECQWTAFWLDDPSANDTSSRYRHPGRRYAPRPHDWDESIERMLNAGLTIDDIRSSMQIALRNSRIDWDESWRYFCGVAWKTLRDRHELALALLEAGDD